MKAIKAMVKSGRVEAEVPPEWADGTEVEIYPHGCAGNLLGDDDPVSPEELARLLAAIEKLESFEITDAEEADLSAWERKVNDYSIANMEKGIEDVFR